MEWIIANWEWFLLGFFVAEKVVKLTPMKWDDIFVDGIKAGLTKMFAKRLSG